MWEFIRMKQSLLVVVCKNNKQTTKIICDFKFILLNNISNKTLGD